MLSFSFRANKLTKKRHIKVGELLKKKIKCFVGFRLQSTISATYDSAQSKNNAKHTFCIIFCIPREQLYIYVQPIVKQGHNIPSLFYTYVLGFFF